MQCILQKVLLNLKENLKFKKLKKKLIDRLHANNYILMQI